MLDALFRNTLTSWQWLLLVAIPPAIVALYFLKLKRQPLEVPSTYLWKKSIEDLHVNSLWQRMRRNLLLLLQLLFIGMVIFALLRPGWQGTRLEGNRFIFLVDNSASMQATDVDDVASRLEEAKRRTLALIDQLESGMTAMIISFADTPRVVQEFTDNHRMLRERLETIEPTFAPTDLKGALELASGLANPGKVMIEEAGIEADIAEAKAATLFIFSDGRFEDVEGFSLGNLDAHYVPIGSLSADNVAITALATRRSDTRPDERQAFVQVTNFTDVECAANVEVLLDGQFLDAQRIRVPAGGAGGAVIPLADAPPGGLQARLALDTDGIADALPVDNQAHAALNDARAGRVLVVSPGNPLLEPALKTGRSVRLAKIDWREPEYLSTDEYRLQAGTGEYDLVIYDRCRPEELPRANTLFIGQVPASRAWVGPTVSVNDEAADDEDAVAAVTAPPQLELPQIIDWNRSHPLITHVDFSTVAIINSYLLNPPAGGDVLIDSTDGPIAAVAPRDSYVDVVLGFAIVGENEAGEATFNTNWPKLHSFPTFWLNALEFLAARASDPVGESVRPGESVELRLPTAGDELTIAAPDGRRTSIRRDAHDVFLFHDTNVLGIYEVRQGDMVLERFAVNLFDHRESDIRVKPSQDPESEARAADIRIGHIDVAAVAGSTPARKELWKLLLVVALVLLLVEWYIYNRRVYV
jgi:hypothetical protein